MADREQVIFSQDAPDELCDFHEIDFYYPERRAGEPSPFACQPFSMNLTDGEHATEDDNGTCHIQIAGGAITVPKGWVFRTERLVKRPRPRPIAPKPPKAVKSPGGEPA